MRISNVTMLLEVIKMEDFSGRIKHIRSALKIERAELAELLGTSTSTICRWENGTMVPNLNALINIKEKTGIPLDYLAGYGDRKDFKGIN